MNLLVHPDREAVAQAVADRIVGLVSAAANGFILGLAGGSTPAESYKAVRGRPAPWERVVAWMSDERWVPPDDERSNGRMAAGALMDHVEAEFHRPRWSQYMSPSDSAAHYEARLRSIMSQERPDLIMLGLGEDGHTASLFPGTDALKEDRRWYVANYVPQLEEDRLTATYPLLWRAHLLMVVTTGAHKASAVKTSFEGGGNPAARLGEGDAVVEWYVDQAAASMLA